MFDISSVSSTASDGTPAWRRYRRDSATRATEEGNLVLSVDDLFTSDPGAALAEWAALVGFSMTDVPLAGAETMLILRTLYQALGDVPPESDLVRAMRAVNDGGSTSLLPDFRVIVDGTFIVACLIGAYCGPFCELDDYLNEIDRRLEDTSPLRHA